jgi:hypothetical protein
MWTVGDGGCVVFDGRGETSNNFCHLALAVGAGTPRAFLPISEYAKIYANLHSCSVISSTAILLD